MSEPDSPLIFSPRSRQRRLLRNTRRWHAGADSFQLASLPGSPHGAGQAGLAAAMT